MRFKARRLAKPWKLIALGWVAAISIFGLANGLWFEGSVAACAAVASALYVGFDTSGEADLNWKRMRSYSEPFEDFDIEQIYALKRLAVIASIGGSVSLHLISRVGGGNWQVRTYARRDVGAWRHPGVAVVRRRDLPASLGDDPRLVFPLEWVDEIMAHEASSRSEDAERDARAGRGSGRARYGRQPDGGDMHSARRGVGG